MQAGQIGLVLGQEGYAVEDGGKEGGREGRREGGRGGDGRQERIRSWIYSKINERRMLRENVHTHVF